MTVEGKELFTHCPETATASGSLGNGGPKTEMRVESSA